VSSQKEASATLKTLLGTAQGKYGSPKIPLPHVLLDALHEQVVLLVDLGKARAEDHAKKASASFHCPPTQPATGSL
jgi:hypothetical protein